MASTINQFDALRIPLEEIEKATNNFDDDNIISHGDFGPAYKGQLLRSGKMIKIAARRLESKRGLGDSEFWTEVSMLSELKHTNLVSIIGFCDEKGEKIIVTAYEANGSLSQFLNSPNLTWMQRLRISLGVARGLSYLHSDEGRSYVVIHRNVNSQTILLDENWEAKLSGFEICVKQSIHRKDRVFLCEPTGTIGYMDPEIEKAKGVTYKSDIYAFGVVLFEILCGRKAFEEMRDNNKFLAPLAKHHYEKKTLQDIIHPYLWNQMSPRSFFKYSEVAYSCLEKEQVSRQDMDYIVESLEKALEFQLQRETNGKNFQHLKIHLSHIKLATDNFSERIGFSFHYNWYRAKLQHFDEENPLSIELKNKGENPKGHQTLLLKRYNSKYEENFYTELEMLSTVKHPNIVTLLGFCVEGHEMIIVVDNVFNSLLGDYLKVNIQKMNNINWEKRLKICNDVAHALDYLHFEMEDQKTIIIRDINSSIIGLDENWGAKIVDFENSVFLPPNQEEEALYLDWHGRASYIDPEYKKRNKLKRESDVYSFGVVLFELLYGKLAYDPIYKKESDLGLAVVARRHISMGTIEDNIDPIIKQETDANNFVLNRGPNKDSLHTFIKIAHKCVAPTQDQRPSMKVVVKELKKALFFQKNNKDNFKILLEDIKLATQNFNKDNCIGGGGFGRVYKGDLQDGARVKTIVAKRLDTKLGQGEQQFLSELQILWEYKHENVIGLVGYCDENDEKIIVYEYASRRSLDRYLNDASLTWMKRLNICIDVARALDFLHGGVGKQAKVIHRDIKTANILLNDDWKAKLADFGLSLISPINKKTDYVIDHVCGTFGYVDPLYKNSGFLTIESDIYSFGVVLFEILCGRSTFSIQKHEGQFLLDFIKRNFEEGKHDEVVFEQIREQIMPKSLTTFSEIAYQCLNKKRENRPTIKQVLMQLKKALKFQEERVQTPHIDQIVQKLEKSLKLQPANEILHSEEYETIDSELSQHTAQFMQDDTLILSQGSKQKILEHLKQDVTLGEHQIRMLKDELQKVEMANKSRLALIQEMEQQIPSLKQIKTCFLFDMRHSLNISILHLFIVLLGIFVCLCVLYKQYVCTLFSCVQSKPAFGRLVAT